MEKILYNEEARAALKAGIDKLANAVKETLGPKGKNVIIRRNGALSVTKDGVTVAQHVIIDDVFERCGADMMKEVASKMADAAGDGTTTATVLAQAIVTAGLKNITSGANPMDLKRGIDMAVKAVVEAIRLLSTDISGDYDKIKHIASISANNDEVIGQLIADAMKEVGKDGVIYMDEAAGMETSYEIVQGMRIERGYLSPYFITNQAKQICELEKPFILLYDGKISNMRDLLPIIQQAGEQGRPLLIIADDVDGEALQTLIVNKTGGHFKSCAVKSPFGPTSDDLMEDIAIKTGGHYLSEKMGDNLQEATLLQLGYCDKVVVYRDYFTIINGNGDAEDIELRINELKSQLEESTHPDEQNYLRDRVAKLTTGVAIIHVGGSTEVEMNERKYRVEDALYATKAAVKEGYVPGGGVAYIRALQTEKDAVNFLADDESIGYQIVVKAMEVSIRQICRNADVAEDVVYQKVWDGSGAFGYNAKTNKYEDLVIAGIIDPTKVAISAIEIAASVAGMILTTSCIVTD